MGEERDGRGCWGSANARSFSVRSKAYIETNMKVSSGDSFYHTIGMDIVAKGTTNLITNNKVIPIIDLNQ